MTPAEAFEITPEERVRLEAAPFRGTDEHGWLTFAQEIQKQVLKAYADDEIALERALEAVLLCSLGCRPVTRAVLLAGTECYSEPASRPTRQTTAKPNLGPLFSRPARAGGPGRPTLYLPGDGYPGQLLQRNCLSTSGGVPKGLFKPDASRRVGEPLRRAA